MATTTPARRVSKACMLVILTDLSRLAESGQVWKAVETSSSPAVDGWTIYVNTPALKPCVHVAAD